MTIEFLPQPNQILYHYTTVDSAEAIVRNKTLRLSEFSQMIDRSEYTYAKDEFVNAYQNRDVQIDEIPRYMVGAMLGAHEPETVMMIGCLTEDNSSAFMWNEYADRGRGCVIGIDAQWLLDRAGVAIRRISYGNHYLCEYVNQKLADLQAFHEANSADRESLRFHATMFVMDLYAFKALCYSDENEVRISRLMVVNRNSEFKLIDVGGNRTDGTVVAPILVQQRQGRMGPTRFVDLPLREDGQRSAIRTIGYGPNIEPRDEILLREAAHDDHQIEFWRSDLQVDAA